MRQNDEVIGATAPASSLAEHLEQVLRDYFTALDGEQACDLYEVVIGEVERPLLTSVMHYVDYNQTRAAQLLGLSRGTLRKKLKQHGLL